MTRAEILAKLVLAAGGIFAFWLIYVYRRHVNWRARL